MSRTSSARRPKIPTPAELQAQVFRFNQTHPVGAKVRYFPFMHPRSGTPVETVTTAEAWVMEGHSAMVMVKDVRGGVCLDALEDRE